VDAPNSMPFKNSFTLNVLIEGSISSLLPHPSGRRGTKQRY